MLMQMHKIISSEDFLELVRSKSEKIPYHRVYFCLKRMRLKSVFRQTVETMRFCISIHNMGLRITTSLIGALRNRSRSSVLETLHALGDKKCLTIVRSSKASGLQWIISALFLKYYNKVDDL